MRKFWLTANISEDTRAQLDQAMRTHGKTESALVESAILHFLRPELPDFSTANSGSDRS